MPHFKVYGESEDMMSTDGALSLDEMILCTFLQLELELELEGKGVASSCTS